MFETAVLANGPANKRIWTTCMGFTGEALVVGLAAMVPLIWPQALPRTQAVMMWLLPPEPPKPQPAAETAPVRVTRVQATRPWPGWMFQPTRIPDRVEIIVDPPDVRPEGLGAVSAMSALARGGEFLQNILAVPLAVAPAAEAPAVRNAPAAIARVKVGGLVKMARPISQPAPKYPPLARAAHVAGTVQLLGVIGADGRIRELKVVSGHPLLAGAALDAVRLWVYEPTRLNGEPVEVEAPIIVQFRLE